MSSEARLTLKSVTRAIHGGGLLLAYKRVKVQFLLIASDPKDWLLVSEGRTNVSGSNAQHMYIDLLFNSVLNEDTV